jgi:hypothetical protein
VLAAVPLTFLAALDAGADVAGAPSPLPLLALAPAALLAQRALLKVRAALARALCTRACVRVRCKQPILAGAAAQPCRRLACLLQLR